MLRAFVVSTLAPMAAGWLGGCAGGGSAATTGGSNAPADAATPPDVSPGDAAPSYEDADSASLSTLPTLLGPDGSTRTSPCSDAASAFVYVLSQSNVLYRFAPDKKTFSMIGTITCAPGQAPNSMAVDRTATAWVNYLDGTLHPVSTADAGCGGGNVTMLPSGWTQDGMAYVSSDAGVGPEYLFLSGANASVAAGLGRVDTATGALTPIGQYTGGLQGVSAELTGTGDGRLFGMFAMSPVTLAQIDPGSGTILSQVPLPALALSAASSFAFSFWGGRFYFYTYPNAGSSTSNVAQYDPATGSLDASYMTDIGFVIVGAGVSTCAPLVFPIPQ